MPMISRTGFVGQLCVCADAVTVAAAASNAATAAAHNLLVMVFLPDFPQAAGSSVS
jgi:hypothetical protein